MPLRLDHGLGYIFEKLVEDKVMISNPGHGPDHKGESCTHYAANGRPCVISQSVNFVTVPRAHHGSAPLGQHKYLQFRIKELTTIKLDRPRTHVQRMVQRVQEILEMEPLTLKVLLILHERV